MKKLEIGPSQDVHTPDGEPAETWDTADVTYNATYKVKWGYEPLPIETGTYDWIHISHVLEHVPWWNTLDALMDAYLALKFGGRITVWVPDAIKIINLAEADPEKFCEVESFWSCGGLNPERDPWVYMNARVFWGARPGERGQEQHFHRAMFGEASLKRLMTKAGFSNVGKIERDVSVDRGHGWMEVGMEGFR